MKNFSNESPQAQITLEPASFISFKDYLVGEELSTNPYASIDDFLDETWNLDLSSTDEAEDNDPPSYS